MNKENEKMRLYYELIREGINGKFGVLPYISGLAVALLVAVRFGERKDRRYRKDDIRKLLENQQK